MTSLEELRAVAGLVLPLFDTDTSAETSHLVIGEATDATSFTRSGARSIAVAHAPRATFRAFRRHRLPRQNAAACRWAATRSKSPYWTLAKREEKRSRMVIFHALGPDGEPGDENRGSSP